MNSRPAKQRPTTENTGRDVYYFIFDITQAKPNLVAMLEKNTPTQVDNNLDIVCRTNPAVSNPYTTLKLRPAK